MKLAVMRLFIFLVWLQIVSSCDFKGRTIKGIGKGEFPYLMLNQTFPKLNNTKNTFDVTPFAKGMIIEVLEEVSKVCNLKIEIHIRQDQKAGKIVKLSNGTLTYDGVFENLIEDDFDLVLRVMTMLPERFDLIDFLYPIDGDYEALGSIHKPSGQKIDLKFTLKCD